MSNTLGSRLGAGLRTLVNRTVGPKPPNPEPANQAQAYKATQDDLITKNFANMRASNMAQKDEAKRQNDMMLARNANASGGFGGAEQKIQEEATTKLNQAFAQNESDIGSQEAQARMGVAEAERGREVQESQFARSMAQATEFFNREFEENSRTNITNSMIALKQSGWYDADTLDWQRFFDTDLGRRYQGAYGGTRFSSVPG